MTLAQARHLDRRAAVEVVAVNDDEIPEVIAHVRRLLGQRGEVLACLDERYLIDVGLDSGDRYQFSPEELCALDAPAQLDLFRQASPATP